MGAGFPFSALLLLHGGFVFPAPILAGTSGYLSCHTQILFIYLLFIYIYIYNLLNVYFEHIKFKLIKQ